MRTTGRKLFVAAVVVEVAVEVEVAPWRLGRRAAMRER